MRHSIPSPQRLLLLQCVKLLWTFPLNLGTKARTIASPEESVLPFAPRPIVFLLFALALTSCAQEKKAATTAQKAGLDTRWEAFPIEMKVDEAIFQEKEARSDLEAARSFWERLARRRLWDFSPWPKGALPYRGSAEDPTELLDNVIFFQGPWSFHELVAGKTFVFAEDHHIRKAAIFLNPRTALCAGICTDEPSSTSRRRLLAHELGHFLGLPHSQNPENVMYPEILRGGSLEGLQVDLPLFFRLTQ